MSQVLSAAAKGGRYLRVATLTVILGTGLTGCCYNRGSSRDLTANPKQSDAMITRTYHLMPSFGEEMIWGTGDVEPLRTYALRHGVEFPPGAGFGYGLRTNAIAFRNTAANHDRFERLLKRKRWFGYVGASLSPPSQNFGIRQ